MKWVTRARPKTDRIACPRLIRRFIDPGAQSFDAPGARYTHRDGKCTFEVLVDEHDLGGDQALVRLARIVHAADIDADPHTDLAGSGLLAIGVGGLDVETDDRRLLERATFVYDSLYAWCARQVGASAPA